MITPLERLTSQTWSPYGARSRAAWTVHRFTCSAFWARPGARARRASVRIKLSPTRRKSETLAGRSRGTCRWRSMEQSPSRSSINWAPWARRFQRRLNGMALPAKASRRRRPCLTELAEQHDASEVISIVSCQTLQLFADGHDAHRVAGPGGTANFLVMFALIIGHGSDLLQAGKETLA